MATQKQEPDNKLEGFEQAAAELDTGNYFLRLYVTGMTSKSNRAVANIKTICEEYLQGRYEMEVIDVYQQPSLVADEQIVALPTLIKKLPLPLRRIIGDMADADKVLLGLDLKPKA